MRRLAHVQVGAVRVADHALHPLAALHARVHELREHLEQARAGLADSVAYPQPECGRRWATSPLPPVHVGRGVRRIALLLPADDGHAGDADDAHAAYATYAAEFRRYGRDEWMAGTESDGEWDGWELAGWGRRKWGQRGVHASAREPQQTQGEV